MEEFGSTPGWASETGQSTRRERRAGPTLRQRPHSPALRSPWCAPCAAPPPWRAPAWAPSCEGRAAARGRGGKRTAQSKGGWGQEARQESSGAQRQAAGAHASGNPDVKSPSSSTPSPSSPCTHLLLQPLQLARLALQLGAQLSVPVRVSGREGQGGWRQPCRLRCCCKNPARCRCVPFHIVRTAQPPQGLGQRPPALCLPHLRSQSLDALLGRRHLAPLLALVRLQLRNLSPQSRNVLCEGLQLSDGAGRRGWEGWLAVCLLPASALHTQLARPACSHPRTRLQRLISASAVARSVASSAPLAPVSSLACRTSATSVDSADALYCERVRLVRGGGRGRARAGSQSLTCHSRRRKHQSRKHTPATSTQRCRTNPLVEGGRGVDHGDAAVRGKQRLHVGAAAAHVRLLDARLVAQHLWGVRVWGVGSVEGWCRVGWAEGRSARAQRRAATALAARCGGGSVHAGPLPAIPCSLAAAPAGACLLHNVRRREHLVQRLCDAIAAAVQHGRHIVGGRAQG